MSYFMYYDRNKCEYYIEDSDGWHQTFSSASSIFQWLKNHFGPGDRLTWVEV